MSGALSSAARVSRWSATRSGCAEWLRLGARIVTQSSRDSATMVWPVWCCADLTQGGCIRSGSTFSISVRESFLFCWLNWLYFDMEMSRPSGLIEMWMSRLISCAFLFQCEGLIDQTIYCTSQLRVTLICSQRVVTKRDQLRVEVCRDSSYSDPSVTPGLHFTML